MSIPARSSLSAPAPASGPRLRPLARHEVTNPDGSLELVSVIEAGEDTSVACLEQYLDTHADQLRARLRRGGCLLFRGFDLKAQAFEQLIAARFEADRSLWMLPLPPRLGKFLLSLPLLGFVITKLLAGIERLATGRLLPGEKRSTLARDDTIQFPHHEYGIFFNIPRVIAFLCETESKDGGETIICDGEAAFRSLNPGLRDRFVRARHIRYKNQNQWWFPTITAPAVLQHPDDGIPTLNFTAYHHDVVADVAKELYPMARVATEAVDETFFFKPTFVEEDGTTTALTREEVGEIARSHLTHSLLLRWKEGDLLLMDNFKILHGRLNAGIPKKTLQIILCNYVRNKNRIVV